MQKVWLMKFFLECTSANHEFIQYLWIINEVANGVFLHFLVIKKPNSYYYYYTKVLCLLIISSYLSVKKLHNAVFKSDKPTYNFLLNK